MEEKMTIKIKRDGSTQIKVSGVKGTGCKALTKDIEEALGTVKSDVRTSEYSEVSNIAVQHKNQA